MFDDIFRVRVYFNIVRLCIMKYEGLPLHVLSSKKISRFSLGVPILESVFPGFTFGDFAILKGSAASFMSFLFSVRSQLPVGRGGLDSSVVFIDGGNSFDPYLVAEIARNYGLDSRSVLEKIYIARAFTVYQLSSLILEKLEPLLRRKRCRLLLISDITSLFLDKNVPKTEVKDLFTKTCSKLSEIALKKNLIVFASYFPVRKFKQDLFLKAILLSKSSFLVEFRKRGEILTFTLEDHPRFKSFTIDFTLDFSNYDYDCDYASLTDSMEI